MKPRHSPRTPGQRTKHDRSDLRESTRSHCAIVASITQIGSYVRDLAGAMEKCRNADAGVGEFVVRVDGDGCLLRTTRIPLLSRTVSVAGAVSSRSSLPRLRTITSG